MLKYLIIMLGLTTCVVAQTEYDGYPHDPFGGLSVNQLRQMAVALLERAEEVERTSPREENGVLDYSRQRLTPCKDWGTHYTTALEELRQRLASMQRQGYTGPISLIFECNKLEEEGVRAIVSLCLENPYLREHLKALNLSNNMLKGDGVLRDLKELMTQCPGVQLDFSINLYLSNQIDEFFGRDLRTRITFSVS